MNKVINVFSILVLVVFTLMSMVIIFDLAISNFHLRALPYKFEILSALAALFFLIGVIRIRRRWQGFRDMSRFSKFDFQATVSKSFLNKAIMFTSLETIFMLVALYLFYELSKIDADLMLVMMAVLAILAIESIVFLAVQIKGGKAFTVGINDQVIAYFTREMNLYFYDGLRRVELHQKDLFSFSYKDDLVLFFPAKLLKQEDRIPFREALLKQLEEKNIYFDDALRNWQ